MQSVYRTSFVEILVDQEKSLIIDAWKSTEESIEYSDFRAFIDKWHEVIRANHLKFGLTDVRKMTFIVVPELQEYAASFMPKTVELGFLRHAMIVPSNDIFMELSIEQTTEEIEKSSGALISRTFTTEEAAKKWLFEQN